MTGTDDAVDDAVGDTADDDRPVAGFFGKLPSTGDFVSRGLPDGFRRNWDAWLTRHVAPLQRSGQAMPDGGIRFRLRSGGRVAAGVIVPSLDSAGRQFPLSLLLIAESLPGADRLDGWCDAALALDRASPDALWMALDDLPSPDGPADDDARTLTLWHRHAQSIEADPADPAAALAQLPGAEVS